MAGYMDVDAAMGVAKGLLKQKSALLKSIDTVRSDLRNAVERKETNADQTKWIGETFPVRERVSATPEQKAERAAKRAAKLAAAVPATKAA